jgi:hypothetical protein
MFLTLVIFGAADTLGFEQSFLVIVTLWTAPWIIISTGRTRGWTAFLLLDSIAERRVW